MQAREIVALLRRQGDATGLQGMGAYGIDTSKALGVRMPALRAVGRRLGRDDALADRLWDEGYRETRVLATMLADPQARTRSQLDAWVRQLADWELCDQCCMNLFRWSPHAQAKAMQWSRQGPTFVRRAGFALIATMAVGRKDLEDEDFHAFLPRIESGASDGRPMVTKAVDWALRSIGKRNARLHTTALDLAHRLQASPEAAAQRVGRKAHRELDSAAIRKRWKPSA